MILITGTGRSGTTYIAELFRQLGYRMLPEVEQEPQSQAGMEGRAKKLSLRLLAHRGFESLGRAEPRYDAPRDPHDPATWQQPLPDDLVDEIKALDADVIKSPHAFKVLGDWLSIRDDIDLVIVCLRDIETVVTRYVKFTGMTPSEASQELFFVYGRAYYTLCTSDVARMHIWFPRSVNDPQYTKNKLESVGVDTRGEFGFEMAHTRASNREWIHQ